MTFRPVAGSVAEQYAIERQHTGQVWARICQLVARGFIPAGTTPKDLPEEFLGAEYDYLDPRSS
jgi:hypothetical protein